MTTTKEQPILFSGPMVRAILDGRKTQTRRIIKPQPTAFWHDNTQSLCSARQTLEPIKCPCGKPGDHLWVKEKSRVESAASGGNAWYSIAYAAGGLSPGKQGNLPKWYPGKTHNKDMSLRWQPSIHMPRWASRITLEVVSVRVERLNDISEADAKAEGCEPGCLTCGENCLYTGGCGQCLPCYRESFIWLWQSINGPDSWAANPWVWVVEFKRWVK